MEHPPLKTFIIYARDDAAFKSALRRHLTPLEQLALLEVWDDSHLLPGEEWEKSIEEKLDESDLVLMLVSEASLFSDFIQKKELKTALARKQQGVTQFVPILVRDCLWDLLPDFKNVQMLPLDPQRSLLAVEAWLSQSSAWAAALRELHRLIPGIQEKIAADKTAREAALAAEQDALRRKNEAEKTEKLRHNRDEAAWKKTLAEVAAADSPEDKIEVYTTYLEDHNNHREEAEAAVQALEGELSMARKLKEKAERKRQAAEQEAQRKVEEEAHQKAAAETFEHHERRFSGLLDAVRRMENSIRRDEEELTFQQKKIAATEGQLEAQLLSAKIKMVEERIVSKREKLAEMLQTRNDVQKQIENAKSKEAKRQKMEAAKEAVKSEIVEESKTQNLPEMILVEGGTFQMGSEEGDADEKPVHKVTVKDFYLGKYPVTFEEYDQFCAETKRDKPADEGWGRGRRPLINVSWEDARAYCDWLSKTSGQHFRLPSEAEWEYAARGGRQSEGFQYAGSDDVKEVGWYSDNSGSKTHPVAGKKPNELGLYDMSGNVWEWCEDDWHGSYKDNPPTDGSAWVAPPRGSLRVYRGGSWRVTSAGARVANRSSVNPAYRSVSVGFRLARTP